MAQFAVAKATSQKVEREKKSLLQSSRKRENRILVRLTQLSKSTFTSSRFSRETRNALAFSQRTDVCKVSISFLRKGDLNERTIGRTSLFRFSFERSSVYNVSAEVLYLAGNAFYAFLAADSSSFVRVSLDSPFTFQRS